VLEGLRKYALGRERQHVLLAGRPGSGKSTTLKRLRLELADAEIADSTQPIPIYIQLKRDSSPLELIANELEKGDIELEEKELKRLLSRNHLLLLFDGVNKIPSEQRRRQLQDFRDDNPDTPMIFTTRDLSVGGDLGIDQRLEMRPLQTQLANHLTLLERQGVITHWSQRQILLGDETAQIISQQLTQHHRHHSAVHQC
jgi:predicted NACHT family NTPase